MKKIMTVVLMVLLIGVLPFSAQAANWGGGDTLDAALAQLKVGFEDTLLDWLVLPNLGVVSQRYTYFMFKNERTGTVDEQPVYCIDPTKGGAYAIVAAIGNNNDGSKTATYIRGDKIGDARYKAILAAGYPHMQLNSLGLQTKREGYYATKLALWMYIRGNDPTKLTINPAYGNSDPVALRVREAAVAIYNNSTLYSVREPQLTMTGKPSATANLDASGTYYVQGVEIYASGWVGTNPNACGDVQLSWSSPPPAGTIVLGTDGADITSTLNVKMVGVDNVGRFGNITVKYPASVVDPETFSPPSLKAEAVLPNDEIYVAYAQADRDKYQRYLVERDPKIQLAASFVSQINKPWDEDFPADSGLRIRKLEAGTLVPLAGAVFEILDPDGKLIYSMATPESGIIDIPLAVMGNYTVTEASPPRYHLLSEKKTQSINVRYGEVAEATFTNEPYGTLRVVKRDAANGRPLGGAAIRIRNLANNATREGHTDSSGSVIFDKLPVGVWEITEQASPDGYVLDTTVYTVNVLPLSMGETSFTLTNKANPGLRIIKYDRQAMTPVDGVTFEVWHDGSLYGMFVTDMWGEVELHNLQPGTYTVREVATREPYVLDATTQWVELKAGQGYIAELVFLNQQKPGIRIIKVDASDMKPLAGAVFVISKVGGSFQQEFKTSANGEIDLSSLEPGAYQVFEKQAPDSYLADDNIRTIQVNPAESATFVFTNTKKPSLIVWKYDEQTAKTLPNTEFSISKKGGSVIFEGITGPEGFIQLDNLEEGWVTITELAPPPGYLLANPASRDVYLVPGKVTEIKFDNLKCPTLTIDKRDSVTGSPIKGVKMNVKFSPDVNFSGGVVNIGDFLTDESGRILLNNNLKAGWYRVTEIEAAQGYILKAPVVQDIFLKGGDNKTLYFENIPKSSLIIRKIDSATSLPVAGATFEIRYLAGTSGSGGTLIKTAVTSINGTIIVTGLQAGTYVCEEITPAQGFQLSNPSVQTAFISGLEQEVVELVFSNPKMGHLVITKLDSVSKLPLAGVTFLVTDSSGAVIGPNNGEYTTDVSGLIEITEWLPIGSTINVKEIRCPDTHNMDAAPQSVKISENTTHRLTFYNSPKSGLQIVKIAADTKQPLSHAWFSVYKKSGDLIGEYETNAEGIIILDKLSPGWVKIVETRSPEGFLLDDTPKDIEITSGQFVKVVFENKRISGLQIKKIDSVTRQPIEGVEFAVAKMNGERVGSYKTDKSGLIYLALEPGWYTVTELKADGYILDSAPRNVEIKTGKPVLLEIENTPLSGLLIIKTDGSSKKPLAGVKFEIKKANGEQVGIFTTDQSGRIYINDIPAGKYVVVETDALDGYILDSTAYEVTVHDGKQAVLEVKNNQMAGLRLLKIDSITKKGIYNVEFMVFDLSNKVVGTYYTDNNGLIDLVGILPEGRYTIRETRPASNYYNDDIPRTVEFKAGEVTEIRWENVPKMGQVQILKKSGDDNQINGLPADTPLANAVFEAYDYKTGNLVDRFVSGSDGRAVSKPLPLGRYLIKEVQAPQYYKLSDKTLDLEIEFATQILKMEYLNYSANTSVYIKKTGPIECMPGDTISYTVKAVQNTSTVPLTDFFWRDILPTDAVRLTKLVTGTYNQALTYKVMITTNKGDTRVIADNLSTTKNNVIDCSNASLGLRSDEYVTSFTFILGTVKAGFAQVEQPQIFVKVLATLPNAYEFANKVDVGGKHGQEWVIGNSTTLCKTYKKPVPLPRTGY
jgi:uncharacterized repeat protein (TIGR01451 family)